MLATKILSFLRPLLLLSICYGSLASAADIQMPTKLNFNKATLQRAKTALDNPANWKKFPDKINMCIFAPGGASSEATNYAIAFMKQNTQFADAAKQLGIDLKITLDGVRAMKIDVYSKKLNLRKTIDARLNLYTDERVAAEDFKNKRCDAVAISSLRARQFNSFVGSLDAIGGITSYSQLEKTIKLLASPQMSTRMINKYYEITSIIPLGSAYTIVRDRKINTLAKAAGKKVAVLDFDKSQAQMVQNVGAQPVSADLTNIGGKFNNGQVDIMVAPAILFKPLELHKGLLDSSGKVQGAIMRFPLLQVTAVVMIQRGRFPAEVGQLVREFTSDNLQSAFSIIDQIEKDIPANYWSEIAPADQIGYMKLMREARISMTKQGFYNKDMMTLLKKVRCTDQPTNYECSMTDE